VIFRDFGTCGLLEAYGFEMTHFPKPRFSEGDELGMHV
jgi:hypothetical protein